MLHLIIQGLSCVITYIIIVPFYTSSTVFIYKLQLKITALKYLYKVSLISHGTENNPECRLSSGASIWQVVPVNNFCSANYAITYIIVVPFNKCSSVFIYKLPMWCLKLLV